YKKQVKELKDKYENREEKFEALLHPEREIEEEKQEKTDKNKEQKEKKSSRNRSKRRQKRKRRKIMICDLYKSYICTYMKPIYLNRKMGTSEYSALPSHPRHVGTLSPYPVQQSLFS